jgi:hypothetical protein
VCSRLSSLEFSHLRGESMRSSSPLNSLPLRAKIIGSLDRFYHTQRSVLCQIKSDNGGCQCLQIVPAIIHRIAPQLKLTRSGFHLRPLSGLTFQAICPLIGVAIPNHPSSSLVTVTNVYRLSVPTMMLSGVSRVRSHGIQRWVSTSPPPSPS